MRCIRSQASGLISGLPDKEMTAMELGLAHSLSRYKLKFSPDKIDTMIVQAVNLLDDLDKELNNYIMRCREWYGWHFPELGKIITDNLAFVRTVEVMGMRDNAKSTDLSDILPEDVEQQLKEFAEVSMGTAIGEDDMENIVQLADQVIEITDYRGQLYEYLKNRMMAIAPNLTVLVGELVGARLIAHAGSLLNLAKHPASTVQILGAEKALFRALKTKQDTPKYGLIYHASMVGQAAPKHKGKISRMLAAKAALAIRYDALCEGDDETNVDFAIEARQQLEKRAKELEFRKAKLSGGRKSAGGDKYRHKSDVVTYDAAADNTAFKRKQEKLEDSPKPKKSKKEKVKEEPSEESVKTEPDTEDTPKKEKKDKKKKKKKDKVKEEAEEE